MKLVSAVLLSVLVPSIAAAQNSGVFIQAGAFADALFASSVTAAPTGTGLLSSGPSGNSTYTWNDLNGDRRWQPGEEGPPVGTSLIFGIPAGDVPAPEIQRFGAGASAAVGVFLTPTVSVRVEASFQGTRVSSAEADYPFDALTAVTRQESSVTDYFIAAGWHHGGARRTTITFLGGLALQRQREEASLTMTYQAAFRAADGRVVNTVPITFDESFGSTSYHAGVMAGVDVPITIATRLAVVPHLRLVAVSRQWNLRPGIALRWNP